VVGLIKIVRTDMKFDPWTDKECIQAYCEENADDFDSWLIEKGIDSRFESKEKYELTYCEKNEQSFVDFAYEFERDMIQYYEELDRNQEE
jgi:hypothetical protein